MSRTSGYQEATNNIYRSVYSAYITDLSGYVDDQKNSDWAKQLFEYCNSPHVLNGLITSNMIDPDNTRINHLCTILDILDPSGRISFEDGKLYSFGAALRKEVVDLTFKFAFENFNVPDKDDKDGREIIITVLADFMRAYFATLGDKKFKTWTEEIYDDARADLLEAAKDAQYDNAQDYINNISDIVAGIADELISMKNPDMPSCIVDYFDKHPKVSKVFSMAFYTIGIGTVVFGFMKWKDLNTDQRAEMIADAVGIGVTALDDALVWRACSVLRDGCGDLIGATTVLKGSITNTSDFVKVLAGDKTIQEVISDLAAQQGRTVVATGSISNAAANWSKVCRITSVAAKVASVLLMAGALGFQIFETVKDFESGQTVAVEVMDIIQDVSCGICFLAEAGSGIVALCGAEVCSAIPVVGTVFAVVGIVAAVVSIFIHRKQPPAPIETFIQKRCVPFVKNALEPPEEWMASQKKIAEYLGENEQNTLRLSLQY
jgi:hypothetical protein